VVGKVRIWTENDQEIPWARWSTVYFADAPVFQSIQTDPEKTRRGGGGAYNARWMVDASAILMAISSGEGFLYAQRPQVLHDHFRRDPCA